MPRVLVAEDNPLSLRFLLEALAQLGIDADSVEDGATAVIKATQHYYDVLLLDNRMPKLNGPEALRQIRSAGIPSTAIATSAEVTPTQRTDLLDAGFAQVLEKPLSLATLENALRPYFPSSPTPKTITDKTVAAAAYSTTATRLLDDAAALPGVGGDAGILYALRKLLIDELIAIPDEFDRLRQSGDRAALRERLHRLQASAGFCGASALAAACTSLRFLVDTPAVALATGIDEVQQTSALTLAALRDVIR